MKKKTLQLSKKLLLKKDTLVTLNQQDQAKLAGGAPLTWWSACCVETDEVTCPVDCVRTTR
ncbi:class I lanthipeptide [Chitinophaga oryzae]|uniref:Class I lanthipeptide n=1 Tax=Chitinophaga oryzae TaxID=2725414 RepID=A0AAE6ZGC0_9BACT|nr:class I lanthipeptide [Chitinophaga oryzae]QJB32483.1 class I lanthipeptide [Chitinophaga oryzae]QJB38956.1 class I lanthipeptide [Chitinophaga oryzae]